MTYKFKNASILIVDDMPPVIKLLQEVLKTFGFKTIITASDGQEAFAKYCRHNPDLILTDWIMPKVDGIDFIKMIRTHSNSPNPFVPVIMITGHCTRVHVEKARDIGVNEFLIKPFSSRDLYVRLEHIIEKPRDFIKADSFFGPDRRRRIEHDFYGTRKRDEDPPTAKDQNKNKQNPSISDQEATPDLLKALREQAQNLVTNTDKKSPL